MMSGADYLRLALTCGSNSNKAIRSIRSGRAATLPVQPKRHVHCGTPHEQRLAAFDYLARLMPREFKPVRFFVLMGVAAFVVCGVTAFYTHRAAHGRTAEERAAYAIGEKVGKEAPAEAKLPTDADLNMMAQKYFKQQGSGEQQSWDVAFENGYTDGFKKTHHRQ